MLKEHGRFGIRLFSIWVILLSLGLIFLIDESYAQEEHVIEVLGKKIPLSFDTKRGVLVIEGDTLRQLPAGSLSELLRFVANMNFISRSDFQSDPQIMGFNQEQIVVMVNRIEILRGGYSTLAGQSLHSQTE